MGGVRDSGRSSTPTTGRPAPPRRWSRRVIGSARPGRWARSVARRTTPWRGVQRDPQARDPCRCPDLHRRRHGPAGPCSGGPPHTTPATPLRLRLPQTQHLRADQGRCPRRGRVDHGQACPGSRGKARGPEQPVELMPSAVALGGRRGPLDPASGRDGPGSFSDLHRGSSQPTGSKRPSWWTPPHRPENWCATAPAGTFHRPDVHDAAGRRLPPL